MLSDSMASWGCSRFSLMLCCGSANRPRVSLALKTARYGSHAQAVEIIGEVLMATAEKVSLGEEVDDRSVIVKRRRSSMKAQVSEQQQQNEGNGRGKGGTSLIIEDDNGTKQLFNAFLYSPRKTEDSLDP